MAESVDDFIAGYVSGAVGIIVGQPLDVIKVRMQVASAANATALSMLRDMYKTEGAGSAFRGIASPIVGLAALNALLFASYGSILRGLESIRPPTSSGSRLSDVFLAGCGAGAICFLVDTPIEVVKCVAQVQRHSAQKFGSTSTYAVAKHLINKHGPRVLYRGGAPTAVRDAFGYGVYFWAYEVSKSALGITSADKATDKAGQYLLAGGMAGVASWASVFPVDVVKSRIQVNMDKKFEGGWMKEMARISRREGTRALWRGIWPALLRAWPVNAVTFFTYEIVISALQHNKQADVLMDTTTTSRDKQTA
ncbi:mitochondrial carrier protein [Ramicandelaber brevisporus]|nr:mitochondrial carrier protein [Ramicandelaber brevisporus]